MSTEMYTLIKQPSFPSLPSTDAIYPLSVSSKAEEYKKIIDKYNREVERDSSLLQDMKLAYEDIEDKYKKIIDEILKHTTVEENKPSILPELTWSEGSKLNTGVSWGLFAFDVGILIAAWRYGKLVKALRAELAGWIEGEAMIPWVTTGYAEIQAARAEYAAEIALTQGRLLRNSRILRGLRIGGGILAVATIGWIGYELYSQRNEAIRAMEKVRQELTDQYDHYNQLANYQMDQALLLRRFILSFNQDANGQGTLKFTFDGNERDYEKLFERAITQDVDKRLQMTEEPQRESDEKYLIKDLRERFNDILTQNLTKLIKFNNACEMAIKYFRNNHTIDDFENNISSLTDVKLTKQELTTIYDEAKKQEDKKAEEVKFFRLYVNQAIIDFTSHDQRIIEKIVSQQK